MKVGHKGIWGHELDAVDISTAQSGLFPTGISSASQRVGGHMAACLWSMAAKNKAWGSACTDDRCRARGATVSLHCTE